MPTSCTPAPRASSSRPTAGRRWVTMRTPHGDNHDIWISPNDGKTMIQSNDGGANVSFDGGTHLVDADEPADVRDLRRLDGQRVPVQAVRRAAGQLDVDHRRVSPNPFDPHDWRTGPGCETGPIMPHPKDPNIVYGSCKGQYEVMNMAHRPEAQLLGGRRNRCTATPGSDLILRFQRVSPMATSPHDPNVAVLRLAVPAPHARQGCARGRTISPGPHREPAVLSGRER